MDIFEPQRFTRKFEKPESMDGLREGKRVATTTDNYYPRNAKAKSRGRTAS
jgi:hypothetical protein